MNFTISQYLTEQTNFQHDWQVFFPLISKTYNENLYIENYVNGKNLACPMPLLKLKMALRTTEIGNGVYLTATDPNSTNDIQAFCQHAGLDCHSATINENNTQSEIFHFLIIKNK